MKKFLTVMACVLFAFTAKAQLYVGGEIGFTRNSDADRTYVSIFPEVGYSINDSWAFGASIGFLAENIGGIKTNLFQINPYARFSFLEIGDAKLFVDGGIGLGFPKDGDAQISVGVYPGIAIPLSDHVSFVGHLGGIDYDITNKVFGIGVTGNAFTAGVYYNF